MRLLNSLRAAAPNENYGLIVQIEAENAGFAVDRLEKVVHDQTSGSRTSLLLVNSGGDVLSREIGIWRQHYTPTSVLAARRFMAQSSVRPSLLNSPRSPATGGSLGVSGTTQRTYAPRSQNVDSDSDMEWRDRNKLYDFSKGPQSASAATAAYGRSTPVERRHRRNRLELGGGSRTGGYNLSGGDVAGRRQYTRSDSLPPLTRARSDGHLNHSQYPATMQSMSSNRRNESLLDEYGHQRFRSSSVTPLQSRQHDIHVTSQV
jgi:hypothetical protein